MYLLFHNSYISFSNYLYVIGIIGWFWIYDRNDRNLGKPSFESYIISILDFWKILIDKKDFFQPWTPESDEIGFTKRVCSTNLILNEISYRKYKNPRPSFIFFWIGESHLNHIIKHRFLGNNLFKASTNLVRFMIRNTIFICIFIIKKYYLILNKN